jgi:hypothetical protein
LAGEQEQREGKTGLGAFWMPAFESCNLFGRPSVITAVCFRLWSLHDLDRIGRYACDLALGRHRPIEHAANGLQPTARRFGQAFLAITQNSNGLRR